MQSPVKADDIYDQGVKYHAQGKAAEAVECFRVALRERPDWAEAHNNLGVALVNRDKHSEAMESFVRAVALKPEYADAHLNLGNSLKRAGKFAEAIDRYKEALRLKPASADLLNNLGSALRSHGLLDEAIDQFRRALAINSDHYDARNNLGVALADRGMHAEAEATYRQVLRDRPHTAETHSNLGVVLVHQGKIEEAVGHYRRALEIRSKYPDAHNNLGNALRKLGKLDDAEKALREAIRLRPTYPEAHNNLAIVLIKQGRVDDGIESYRKAIKLRDDYPDAHKNLGLALLGSGSFAEGWREYEWRWKGKEMPVRNFTQPRWDGGPLEGKTILLHWEQGLGDTIQFVRYAPLVEKRGGRVVLECQKKLVRLLENFPGVTRLVPQGEPLGDFDVYAPLLSVPGILGTGLGSIPAEMPYLTAEPARREHWQAELGKSKEFKIGICWQGSTTYPEDSLRSIPLTDLEPLARVPGVKLFSLQKGFGSEQLTKLSGRFSVTDLEGKLDDFVDTAAVVKNLDLVITADTSPAHLAGALGVPVWVAIPFASCWRWLRNREDSPWYPTMRLFRQGKRGDWKEVFERMAAELERVPALANTDHQNEKGRSLLSQGKHAEATAVFRRALEQDPKSAILHNNLGAALDAGGKRADAISCFQEAIRLKPDYGDALHNLGNMLRRSNRMAEAETEYRKALNVLPDHPDLSNHMGLVLLGQARHEEAEKFFRQCLHLDARHSHAHNNLAVLLEQLGQALEANGHFQESLRINGDSVDTHKNLALNWLKLGEYERGWPEYEWRWKTSAAKERKFVQPRWDGRRLDGEVVLLYPEQGFGDTIQFIRYARLVKERGGSVMLDCPSELQRLLSRCPGIDRVLPPGIQIPEFAYQSPLLSLPNVLHTTLETIPAQIPYLSADPELVKRWGEELAGISGYRVGIAWQGSKKYQGDAHRSIPLAAFEPLAAIPGVRLISLQKGAGTDQLSKLGERFTVMDLGAKIKDFADTAALMMNLDLVISVDSAPAHLAGALGIPVWVPLPVASCWRWLLERRDTPWYPSMRLYRQKRWGDWDEVFQRIARDLPRRATALSRPIRAKLSPGELVDRITILEVKRQRTPGGKALRHIRVKLGTLLALRARSFKASRELGELTAQLKAVNQELWRITNEIRDLVRREDFGDHFIEASRCRYDKQSERRVLKRRINECMGG